MNMPVFVGMIIFTMIDMACYILTRRCDERLRFRYKIPGGGIVALIKLGSYKRGAKEVKEASTE